jgi:hypothetical protein
VLCVGIGTRLTNRYLVMCDFTVETMFTQPLAGNGRMQNVSKCLVRKDSEDMPIIVACDLSVNVKDNYNANL